MIGRRYLRAAFNEYWFSGLMCRVCFCPLAGWGVLFVIGDTIRSHADNQDFHNKHRRYVKQYDMRRVYAQGEN